MRHFRTIFALSLTLLLTTVAPDPARAWCNVFGCPYVVDDFTQGVLPPANGPFDFTHVGLPTENCLGGSRQVWVKDVEGASAGMVLLPGGDIGFEVRASAQGPTIPIYSNAHAALRYSLGDGTDVTANGRNDRFVIDVLDANQYTALVMFHYPGGASGKSEILQPGPNIWPLSDILGDPTQLTEIKVTFHYYGPEVYEGVLTLNRIRLTGNGSSPLHLRVPDWVEFQPPFLSPGPYMGAWVQDEVAGFQHIQDTELTLVSARRFTAEGTFVGDSSVRISSATAGSLDLGVTPSAGYAVDVGRGWILGTGDRVVYSFDLATMARGSNTVSRIYFSSDPFQPTADQLLIHFLVDYQDHAGEQQGTVAYRMRVQTRDESAYDLLAPMLYPPDPIDDPDFGFGFTLENMGAAKTLVTGDPLLTITLEADLTPPALTSAAPLAGPAGAPLLAALPSVTDSRTVLRLARPLSHTTAIRIYDLAGRLVRELQLAAEQPTAAWDTRDSRGRPVTSGIYFAKIVGAGDVAARKIVVAR